MAWLPIHKNVNVWQGNLIIHKAQYKLDKTLDEQDMKGEMYLRTERNLAGSPEGNDSTLHDGGGRITRAQSWSQIFYAGTIPTLNTGFMAEREWSLGL